MTVLADVVLAVGNCAAVVYCALYLRGAPGGGLWLPLFLAVALASLAMNAGALARMRTVVVADSADDALTDAVDPTVDAFGDVAGQFRLWDREYRPAEIVVGACALFNLRAIATLVSQSAPVGARGLRAALAAPVREELVGRMLLYASACELFMHGASCAIVLLSGLLDGDNGWRVFLRPELCAKLFVDLAIAALSVGTLVAVDHGRALLPRQVSAIAMPRLGPVVLGDDGYQHDALLEPQHSTVSCYCWCRTRRRPAAVGGDEFVDWQRRAI